VRVKIENAQRAARLFGAKTDDPIEQAEALLNGMKLAGASKAQIRQAELMLTRTKEDRRGHQQPTRPR
jgi:hypothetical protein